MTTDDVPGVGTVIHLFGPPPAVDGAPTAEGQWERGHFCYPHAPRIDKVSRLVVCDRCKQQLDPVDVLLEVASRHQQWVRLSEECRTMRREIEALKAEEKRVKARTAAASRKDAEQAVAEERDRSQERRFRTIAAARDIIDLAKTIQRHSGGNVE